MKQEIKLIHAEDVEKLNKEGWYIKQVIKVVEGACACSKTRFYVLLEKEQSYETNW